MMVQSAAEAKLSKANVITNPTILLIFYIYTPHQLGHPYYEKNSEIKNWMVKDHQHLYHRKFTNFVVADGFHFCIITLVLHRVFQYVFPKIRGV